MKTAKEILIEAFHAGRRFGNGTFPIQTFDEWYESNDIEAKVKNLAQPDVSGNEALRVALLAFADHLNTYKGFEEYRFDFMVVDYLESKQ